MRLLSLPLVLLALVGCGSSALEGKVVNGLTGDPVSGLEIVATANSKVRLTCQKHSDTTGEDGTFAITDVCLSETSYSLVPSDEMWLFTGVAEVSDADAVGEIEAWQAPAGDGVYELTGGDLSRISTHADLKELTLYKGERTIEYTPTLPSESEIVVIEPGEHLVLSGGLDQGKFVPLVPSGPRRFGNEESWTDMDPWWYLGVEFQSDTEVTDKSAELAVDKIMKKSGGDRKAMFVPADALPEGRYALRTDKGRRVWILDFGSKQTFPEELKAKAEEDAEE